MLLFAAAEARCGKPQCTSVGQGSQSHCFPFLDVVAVQLQANVIVAVVRSFCIQIVSAEFSFFFPFKAISGDYPRWFFGGAGRAGCGFVWLFFK